jgi:hypothetical protein
MRWQEAKPKTESRAHIALWGNSYTRAALPETVALEFRANTNVLNNTDSLLPIAPLSSLYSLSLRVQEGGEYDPMMRYRNEHPRPIIVSPVLSQHFSEFHSGESMLQKKKELTYYEL